MTLTLIKHDDHARCSWCGQGQSSADYMHYHDHEWGRPTLNEQRLFEKIVLEGFQSGLSWITVLRKRERFRQVFHHFDFFKVARMSETEIDTLVLDAGIIRHRGKIRSAINNAQKTCDLIDRLGEGALARLVWSFEPSALQRPQLISPQVASSLTQSHESAGLSTALRKLGFSFVGPTTMYAFMQSLGVVNDHLEGCHSRDPCELLRTQFKRP